MEKILRLFSCVIIAILLLTITAFAGEKVYFYHTDPAGTPLAMTDANGNVVWRADYKPFGEEQSVTPYPENDMKFVGKEKDKETGLYYFGARYMRPEIGRFISVDPVGPVNPWNSKTNEKMLLNPQKLNRYAYSLNNPYRYVDPDGEAAIEIKHFLEFRQQLLGWAPSWLQEFLMPVDISIGPMAIESGGRIAGKAFEAAKAGGKHAGFLKNYVQRTEREIQRAIRSLERRTEEHLQKVANPEKYAEGWSGLSIERQQDMIKYWQKEATTYREQAEVLRGLIKEKFEGGL